jgi:hypothetical protein
VKPNPFITTIVAFLVLLPMILVAVNQREASSAAAPRTEPKPSSVVSQYDIQIAGGYTMNVTEFRDSAGRICVVAQQELGEPALDCGYPRDYSSESPE